MDKVELKELRTLYTVGEVAAALRVSSETIRRKIAQGELRAVEITHKPRKQYRILLRDLTDWLGEEQARGVRRRGGTGRPALGCRAATYY